MDIHESGEEMERNEIPGDEYYLHLSAKFISHKFPDFNSNYTKAKKRKRKRCSFSIFDSFTLDF